MLFLIKHSLHTNLLVATVFITRGPSAFSASHQFRHKWVDSINGNYRNIFFATKTPLVITKLTNYIIGNLCE